MHSVVIDKPYQFVPPYRGWFWPRLLQRLVGYQLAKEYGIERVECSGVEHLQQSLRSRHGIVLAPNHCRPSDPMVVNQVCRQAGVVPFTMASWHLFMAGRLQAFVLRRAGAFSVYREGMDRQALQAAVEILQEAKRPLVIFPEGVITRTNDRVIAMMEGLSFIARSAAKKGVTDGKQVVVHPVAIRYHFHGDLEQSLHIALDDIEQRLSWRPDSLLKKGSDPLETV
ncbi:MAG: lysophospholipid acyltransferase family protein, partial [Pirellulales bacterium]|nr:lysophospholipid acyltransferase family protein [Pirellulales bacterium]